MIPSSSPLSDDDAPDTNQVLNDFFEHFDVIAMKYGNSQGCEREVFSPIATAPPIVQAQQGHPMMSSNPLSALAKDFFALLTIVERLKSVIASRGGLLTTARHKTSAPPREGDNHQAGTRTLLYPHKPPQGDAVMAEVHRGPRRVAKRPSSSPGVASSTASEHSAESAGVGVKPPIAPGCLGNGVIYPTTHLPENVTLVRLGLRDTMTVFPCDTMRCDGDGGNKTREFSLHSEDSKGREGSNVGNDRRGHNTNTAFSPLKRASSLPSMSQSQFATTDETTVVEGDSRQPPTTGDPSNSSEIADDPSLFPSPFTAASANSATTSGAAILLHSLDIHGTLLDAGLATYDGIPPPIESTPEFINDPPDIAPMSAHRSLYPDDHMNCMDDCAPLTSSVVISDNICHVSSGKYVLLGTLEAPSVEWTAASMPPASLSSFHLLNPLHIPATDGDRTPLGGKMSPAMTVEMMLAFDVLSNRAVVVRSFHFVASDRLLLNRLLADLEPLKRIHHNHLVDLFDTFVDVESNLLVVVTEYADHGSVAQVANTMMSTVRLTTEGVYAVAVAALDALQYLHCVEGISHSNVCPENILVDKSDRILLAGAGMPRELCQGYTRPRNGNSLQGRQAHDLCCLGNTLHCLLYGIPPPLLSCESAQDLPSTAALPSHRQEHDVKLFEQLNVVIQRLLRCADATECCCPVLEMLITTLS